jgi:DNA-binding HxlR family transcriptional regulator
MASWLDDAEAVIEVISRKWAVPVLGALADGPRRHNELLRAVGCGIHPTVLDGTLRHLEQAGLVRREASTGTPLASWYQLTDLSRSLMDRIACLAQWADEQRPMLAALPVPLEYSIKWVTCTFASRCDVRLVSLPGAAQDRLLAHVPGARPGRPDVPW